MSCPFTGFYRVNYGTDNWESLIEQLAEKPAAIHVLNRAQLVDDSFNLARADKLHYSVPLRLSTYLKIEEHVLPWYPAIESYSYLLERMRRDDTEYSRLRVGTPLEVHSYDESNETVSLRRKRFHFLTES